MYKRQPDTPLPDLSDVTALLAQAKALHDELEAIYNPHVDFARVYALANSHACLLYTSRNGAERKGKGTGRAGGQGADGALGPVSCRKSEGNRLLQAAL